MSDKKIFHSGFVAIIGRPNVGKSTLMNRILKQKVAIMSDKAQTTRNKIHGVYTREEGQIVFIDTPGIHKPKHELGHFMLQSAYSALKEVEAILFLVNAEQKKGPGDEFIIEKLKEVERTTPIYLLINKIDKIHPDELPELIERYRKDLDYREIFPISALQGNNVDRLVDALLADLPEGPQYYPANQVSDHPEYFIVGEFIREKILLLTKEEIPHSVAVVVESMKRDEYDKIYIRATIVVEHKSQKGIIIGQGGKMIKAIGSKARKDIEALLGNKVFLELWVKVEKKWRNKQRYLQDFGYKETDY